MPEVLAPYTLPDAHGNTYTFPTGRPILFCFVDEECLTCALSMPLIEGAHRHFNGDLDVWAIGQDTEGNARLRERHALTLPLLDDSALKVSYAYDVEVVPTVILADEHGREVRRFIGFGRRDWQELYGELARLAGVPEPGVAWEEYPELRPGCGSRSVEPGIAERLAAEAEGSPIRARRVEVPPAEDIVEFMYEQGLTDGLPVVPPTPERVVRMLEGTARDPREVVAIVPPNMAPATVEKIAINAVMAGCRPEHLPVVIAALEAVCTEEFNIHGVMATTMGAAPGIVVNGPIRHRIGMNMQLGALGQGNRANATIGRALRLVVRNVGGAKPGGTERSTLGTPMKYTFSFAEWEERSPWEPLHVERGFRPGDSVVTVFPLSGGPQMIVDQISREARVLGGSMGLSMEAISNVKSHRQGDVLLVVSPEHADTLWHDGWTKDDLRRRIQEITARPLRELLPDGESGATVSPSPPGGGRFTEEQFDERLPKFRDPSAIHIVVAGGEAGKFSGVFSGWASLPVSRRIEG